MELIPEALIDPFGRLVLADHLEELGRETEAVLCRGSAPLFLSQCGIIMDGTIRVTRIDPVLRLSVVQGPWEPDYEEPEKATELSYYDENTTSRIRVMSYLAPLSRVEDWPYEDEFRSVVIENAVALLAPLKVSMGTLNWRECGGPATILGIKDGELVWRIYMGTASLTLSRSD